MRREGTPPGQKTPPPAIPPKPDLKKIKLFPFEDQKELEEFAHDAPETAVRLRELAEELRKAQSDQERQLHRDGMIGNLMALTFNEPSSPAGKKAQKVLDRIQGNRSPRELPDLEQADLTDLRPVLSDIRKLKEDEQKADLLREFCKQSFKLLKPLGMAIALRTLYKKLPKVDAILSWPNFLSLARVSGPWSRMKGSGSVLWTTCAHIRMNLRPFAIMSS